jgi:hypothetical protein
MFNKLSSLVNHNKLLFSCLKRHQRKDEEEIQEKKTKIIREPHRNVSERELEGEDGKVKRKKNVIKITWRVL